MTSFRSGLDDVGCRLDQVVARHLHMSRAHAAALIEAGEVEVNGRQASKSQRLRTGDQVQVNARNLPQTEVPQVPPIVYRDEHLLVINKPAGLVVHQGTGHSGDTLVDALVHAGVPLRGGDDPTRPGVVHRLDRDTSGLLLVACSNDAYRSLQHDLAHRAITRRYVALVEGQPQSANGRIEGPIGRDPDHRTRFAVVVGGRDAVTRYRTVSSTADRSVTLLACALETGRTHQIRVHLSALGHPVIGDALYGASTKRAAAVGLERQALHAFQLSFAHPISRQKIELEAALPDDLARACDQLGLTMPEDRTHMWP